MFLFEIRDLTKTFYVNKKSFNAVSHVSFNLPTSGFVSIVGKSGCGKSTLLNLIMGIEKRTSGKIIYCGKDISTMNEKSFSNYHLNEISMVYQHYNLLSDLSVIENVSLPLRIAGKSNRSAKKTSLKYLELFNLDHLKDRNVKNLSGGEKQRIAIIRALVTNPKVILCDEPTGALDSKNADIVMKELKKISSSKLVLMVSHNTKLVDKYSDRIIQMRDGRITHVFEKHCCKYDQRNKENDPKYSDRWTTKIAKKSFLKRLGKNIFSILSCSIGFAMLLLGIGFLNGSEQSQENALEQNLSVGYATVSKTTYFSLQNSPLQFKKNVRPSFDLIDKYLGDFESIKISENINYLFSPYPSGTFNGQKVSQFEMVPILKEYVGFCGENMRIAGDFDNFSNRNIIVNEEFVNILNITPYDVIGKNLEINSSTIVSYPTGDSENPFVKDQYIYKQKVTIVAVVKEFSFLNSPKAYYSYDDMKVDLQNEIMPELSKYLKRKISYFDYISESNDDDPQSSYSYFLLLKNTSEKNAYFDIIKKANENNQELEITSTAFDIAESYTSFISSFSDALIFFMIIAFVGILFILGMISLSNFLEAKKQSAILTCLGAKNKSIKSIFLKHNFVIVAISFVLSFLFASLFESALNSKMQTRFGLTRLISVPFSQYFGIPYGLEIALFLVAFISVIIFTITPITIYKRYSLSEELRDE